VGRTNRNPVFGRPQGREQYGLSTLPGTATGGVHS
jgi:hypothetical protein